MKYDFIIFCNRKNILILIRAHKIAHFYCNTIFNYLSMSISQKYDFVKILYYTSFWNGET